MIEAGAVTHKNRSAALIKNLYSVCLGAIVFWLFGYGFGFGNPDYFVGHEAKFYASQGFELYPEDNYLSWDI
jgi:ammonia channel protein AmtB